jgi:heat shock protein HslJ
MDRLQAHRERLQASRKRLWHLAIWLTLAGTAALFMAAPSAVAGSGAATVSASSPMEHRPLRGTYWKVVELGGAKVAVSDRVQEPHLNFSASELRVSGSSGCNRLMGSFEHQGAALKFGPLAGTRMACLEPALASQEQQIFTQLQRVRSYRIHGDDLALLDATGQVLLKLQSVMLR